ncbi:MAG: (2Fe-2S)-binding protein [Pseudonocardiaceae bacterium]
MYACICAAVTEPQVHASILAGAGTVDEIGERCGAGTGCGSCVEHLHDLLEDAQARCPLLDRLPHSA